MRKVRKEEKWETGDMGHRDKFQIRRIQNLVAVSYIITMAPHSGKKRSSDASSSDGNKRAKEEEAPPAPQGEPHSAHVSETDDIDPMTTVSRKHASKVGLAREKPIPVTVLSGFLGAGEFVQYMRIEIFIDM